MELLYRVQRKQSSGDDEPEWPKKRNLPERKPLIAVSVKNIVAFTSYIDFTKRSEKPESKNNTSQYYGDNVENSGSNVYVADLNTPWDTFLVKNSCSHVTRIHWDHTGMRLLVGTEDGDVEVLGMTDNLMNRWNVLFNGSLPGESILTSAWLTLPRRVLIVPEKLESPLYSDKYQVSVQYGSKGFGGKALDGVLVVTSTGLLGSYIKVFDDPVTAISTTEKLFPLRTRIICADIAYTNEGDLMVVSAGENLKQPIQLRKVSVSLVGGSRECGELTVDSAQSFFLPYSADRAVTAVKFISITNTQSILVALQNKDNKSSMLYLYELVSQTITLKARFQPGNEVVNNFRWQQTHQIQFNVPIEEISTLSLPLLASNNQLSPGGMNHSLIQSLQPLIAVILRQKGPINLLRAENLQQVQAGGNPGSVKTEGPSDAKIPRLSSAALSSEFSSIQFTWSGSLIAGIDSSSRLFLQKVHSNYDAGSATSLLELSVQGGLDTWDILACIRPSMVENVAERLSDSFTRQPHPVQWHYNVKILALKSALFRMTPGGGQTRSTDQQTLLTLHLVYGSLKALLRPADLPSHDKGPAESLTSLLSSIKGEDNIDKILLQIEPKQYAVETSTLNSLQQVFQWVGDLALKVLATLPDMRNSRAPGWEVCRDAKAIGIMRELLVLMRIWGLLRPSCLPAFRKTSDGLDVLQLLFRLLTRLAAGPIDPEETLMDECCLLGSDLQIPNYSSAFWPTRNHGLLSSTLFNSRNFPIQMEFGASPVKSLQGTTEQFNMTWTDGLRLLWLGKSPVGVKICNRCGSATSCVPSVTNSPPRSAANKAWDHRWLRNCPCGGTWKIPSFLPQPRAVLDTDAFLNF